jgi:putative peptidoglycan lipid II flippase
VPPKRSKRRKEDDEPQLFYVQRTPPPKKPEPDAPAAPPQPVAKPPPTDPPAPATPAKPKPAEPPQPEAVEPAPSTPEEAIPALTEREPTNPEMSNPAPLGKIDELPTKEIAAPPPKATTQRLGILKHDAPPPKQPSRKSGSKKSAVIVGIAVMASRLMGVVREQVFAFMFGSSLFADAFIAAFRIPNLLRDLFAEGALSTAFTTTFTKTWEKEGPESAWRLARLVLSSLTFLLGIICILGTLFAPGVVYLVGGGFENVPGKFELTVAMTQLMFPFILFVSVAAAVMGILNSRHVFGIPASASTVFNVVSIVGGVVFAAIGSLPATGPWHWSTLHFGQGAIFGWCFGVLLGGLAQLGIQLPALWKVGFHCRGIIKFRDYFSDPGLRTVMILMVPSAIAGSAVQVNVAVNGQFASHIPGAMSWLYYAFRLVQLPIGIFGVAIATVTLPAVARQHALDDLKAFGKTVEEALRFGFYLTLPASIGLCAIAQPVIQLIYEHGSFKASSTEQTALALQAYTIGLAGYSGIKILVPCFYAMQPPRFESIPGASFWQSFRHFVWNVVLFTPARVSLLGIAINLVLCYVLFVFFRLGQVGLAMTTGFVAVLNFLQLVHAISKKINLGATADWVSYFARVTLATLACGVTVLALDHLLLANRTTHSLLGALILFFNIAFAVAVYLGLTFALKVPESLELLAFIKRKFGRSFAAS